MSIQRLEEKNLSEGLFQIPQDYKKTELKMDFKPEGEE